MEINNEINICTPRERAPSLMYLIELDPNISTCLTTGNLPLQMLNVNQNNTHYLIPIQETVPLDIQEYKHHQHHEEPVSTIPSGISRNVKEATLNATVTNGSSHQSKVNNSSGCGDTNERSTNYGLGNLKSNTECVSNIKSEKLVEQRQTVSKRSSTGFSGTQLQPLGASDAGKQARNYVHLSDSVPPPLAVQSLPSALRLHCGHVSPRKLLPLARFGPVRGLVRDVTNEVARELILKAAATSKPVFLLSKGDAFCHIDVSDQEKSNWFSLLPLGSTRSANLWLQQEGEELFAVTTHRLDPRTPLSLGYSQQYAQQLRLPPALPVQNLEYEEEQRKWWCEECGHESKTEALLQRHDCPADTVFKPNRRKRRYRCKHCALPFARLFTLKRHQLLHCKNKATFSDVKPQPVAAAEVSASSAGDEERLPSDESFQNYTALDFSTTLFDAELARDEREHDEREYDEREHDGRDHDEREYGGHEHDERDHDPLPHGHGAGDVTAHGVFSPLDYSKKDTKAGSIKCPHCQMVMSSNMKHRHKRQCAARSVQCACGAAFRERARLARHLRAHHSHEDETDSNTNSYKCEQCQNTFKRRGMLVNHLWRVHGAAARVPLTRRQRHYPCVACPKLYRTAAKRDRHVRTHHPGAELMRAQCIESGAVRCEPAACAACPRQYATRAKLLQHMRAAHPLLAPPSKSRPQKRSQNGSH